jgi:hypothetical protein
MTLQDRIDDGHMARPSMFLQRRRDRLWVWNGHEFSQVLDDWAAGKRKTQGVSVFGKHLPYCAVFRSPV